MEFEQPKSYTLKESKRFGSANNGSTGKKTYLIVGDMF